MNFFGTYRIVLLSTPDHGVKYYPQVRRFLFWRNILPAYEPACGTQSMARGVIYNCAHAADAVGLAQGSLAEHFPLRRSEWRKMVDLPDTRDMVHAGREAAQAVQAAFAQDVVNHVSPTQPWPRGPEEPEVDHIDFTNFRYTGRVQPDPFAIIPWPWRWISRLLSKL